MPGAGDGLNALRVLLAPLSWIYGLAVTVRNRCYDAGILRAANADVPVISVGNITAGGSGKTPFVEYLLRYYSRTGKRAAVLSRGYRRTTKGFQTVSDGTSVSGDAARMGDEPYQIARKFPGAVVCVDEDRVKGARIMAERFKPDVLLLDDGFQHRRLGRVLDIVIIGAGEPVGSISLLPAGLRREPFSSLKRAGLVVWNGGEDAHSAVFVRGFTNAPFVSCWYRPVSYIRIGTGEKVSNEIMKGRKLVAVAGIANPGLFLKTLSETGVVPAATAFYPDHYRFGEKDIRRIAGLVRLNKADGIVTTEKDSVRLVSGGSSLLPDGIPGWYLEIEMAIGKDEPVLHGLLARAAGEKG